MVRRGEKEEDLYDPVGEPADDIDRDDGEDEPGYPLLEPLVTGGPGRSDWSREPQLEHHQAVEGEDQQART